MMKNLSVLLFLVLCTLCTKAQVRTEYLFEKGWKFTREDGTDFMKPGYDDARWQSVKIPHDWAIYGPFSIHNDQQKVAIVQDGQKAALEHAGRTGGLPFVGVGWYRLRFEAPAFTSSDKATLIFDGAMSHAKVYLNGHEIGYWPYGYNSFYLDATPYMKPGESNLLAVRLENETESSRWYPGAGLYRNVHLRVNKPVHIPVWGTYLTTPVVKSEYAKVHLNTALETGQPEASGYRIVTELKDQWGKVVASGDKVLAYGDGNVFEQSFVVRSPELWSPETPVLYTAVSRVYDGQELIDEHTTPFGIRSLEFIPDKGFFLNGKKTYFKGACMHHDLGPLGAAVNDAAIRRQIRILKDMGCNAIRTSHNMPAPELIKACDEMGMMVMAESFDEWKKEKCMNGYHKVFDEWAEKDLVNLLHQYRNHPSIVMWCIGNEVSEQWGAGELGAKITRFLRDICHREDPTRPVTMGMDGVDAVIKNNMAATLDIPGFDYLGEPTPYYTDWPSHSSLFGVVDLAGLPKDRYFLYRSHWNKEQETLHVLPHWNWEGREGEVTPVFVYTNYPSAELFINGKSQGRRTKDLSVTVHNSADSTSIFEFKRQQRYRLMWMDTRYEPGTVKVVAYDKTGKAVAETEMHTAGKPHHIELVADRNRLRADGKDLAFVTVKVVDKDGNFCPDAQTLIQFRVKGEGSYRAGANGNPASLEQFHLPQMHVFNGMMTAIVQSSDKAGKIVLEATGKGLKKALLTVETE